MAKVIFLEATKKSEALRNSVHALKELTDNADDSDLSLIACGTFPCSILQMHVQYYSEPDLNIMLSRIINNLLSTCRIEVV